MKKGSVKRKIEAAFFKLRRKRINQKLLVYLVMVLISAFFWFFNKSGETINSVMTFKLDFFGLPQNHYLLPGITTGELNVTVSARGAYFLTHNGSSFPIKIDLSKLDIRTFPDADSTLKFVTNDDIRSMVDAQMPAECKCVSIKPDTIKLDFGRSATKKVPIHLEYDITFDRQFRLAQEPILSPDSVDVTGSINVIDSIAFVQTEKISIAQINESKMLKARLLAPKDVISALAFTEVNFRIEKFTENSIEIPIKTVNVPDSVNLRVFPQTVTLRYNISWANFNSVSPEMFNAVVDYSDLFAPVRPKFLPVKIAKFPDNMGVTNMQLSPEGVEFIIERNLNKDNQE